MTGIGKELRTIGQGQKAIDVYLKKGFDATVFCGNA